MIAPEKKQTLWLTLPAPAGAAPRWLRVEFCTETAGTPDIHAGAAVQTRATADEFGPALLERNMLSGQCVRFTSPV